MSDEPFNEAGELEAQKISLQWIASAKEGDADSIRKIKRYFATLVLSESADFVIDCFESIVNARNEMMGEVMTAIRAEFWIECSKCQIEKIMVANVRGVGRPPKTKGEAWAAALGDGWSGTAAKPICPDCKGKCRWFT